MVAKFSQFNLSSLWMFKMVTKLKFVLLKRRTRLYGTIKVRKFIFAPYLFNF